MIKLSQSPTDPVFVQDPYAFYTKARRNTPVAYWEDYGMLAAFDHATVHALLRDKRLGREVPADLRQPVPDHLKAFDAIEQHSMLEKEGDTHRRLRGLVLRAFTSRRIANLNDDILEICADLIAAFPKTDFDLISAYCTQLPVRVIARLLGVPEEHGDDLLRWSNAMVAMYQANRSRAIEDAANTAAAEFSAFLTEYIDTRRDDLRLTWVDVKTTEEVVGAGQPRGGLAATAAAPGLMRQQIRVVSQRLFRAPISSAYFEHLF